MTLRHSAALGLLGWYLLLPPDVGKPLPETSVPFSMWKRGGDFESEQACAAGRKEAIAEFERQSAEYAKLPGDPRRGWIRFHHDQVYRSLCIAGDDPLLEAK